MDNIIQEEECCRRLPVELMATHEENMDRLKVLCGIKDDEVPYEAGAEHIIEIYKRGLRYPYIDNHCNDDLIKRNDEIIDVVLKSEQFDYDIKIKKIARLLKEVDDIKSKL